MTTLNIYGIGGFGRQVLPPALLLLKAESQKTSPAFDALSYLDDGAAITNLFGVDVRSPAEAGAEGGCFVIAVSNAQTRKFLAEKCLGLGLSPYNLIAQTARVSAHAQIGSGAIICDFALVEPGVGIGTHFHANIYSYVAHDCVIGDYVTFAPRVSCNGNVHIEDDVYIGAGAVIKQGTPANPLVIGKGATIGMGAVVTKDVPSGAVVVGNPARVRA